MNITHLRNFFDVVRFGSFVRAAREIRSSQPTLSRSVRLLEEGMKVTLMIRGKGGIKLTEDGKLLYAETAQILDQIDTLENRLKKREAPRTLRIAASENLCIHVLPSFIKIVLDARLYSSVDLFSGTADQIEERVVEANADFGIFFNPPQSAWLKRKILGEVEFKLIFPRGKSRKDLKVLPFVGSRASDYSRPYFAYKTLKKNYISPSRIIMSNSQEAQIRMVTKGVGYSVVPKFLAEAYEGEIQIDATFSENSKVHCVFRNEIPKSVWGELAMYFTSGCAVK